MPAEFITLNDLEPANKRVLIRADFNVPVRAGVIQDDTRIRACLPTLERLLAAPAALILISHLGRPKEGQFNDEFSLAPVANHVSTLLERQVRLVSDWEEGVSIQPGEIVMLENIRFMPGETSNSDRLAKRLANLCDIYVNDAFATAHRAQASTHGVARYAPIACAGPLLLAEIEMLTKALEQPARPMTAIVGGAKVSTKLLVLENLIKQVDRLIVGGGIANTFLKAAGQPIGNSLYEQDLVGAAADILAYARDHDKEIPLPEDVVCAKTLAQDAAAQVKTLAQVEPNDLIVDVGPRTIAENDRIIRSSATILWNGPLGVFEIDQFSSGTASLARAIAASPALSIAGGGDTVSAITRFGVADGISCISTGGGAFLELLEGKTLPAVAVLEEAMRNR